MDILKAAIEEQLSHLRTNDLDGEFEFPNACLLTDQDVWDLYDGRVKSIAVVPPQNYDRVHVMTAEDFMMRGDDSRLTYFEGCEAKPPKKTLCCVCAMLKPPKPVFSGSGSDVWLKANQQLFHALADFNQKASAASH